MNSPTPGDDSLTRADDWASLVRKSVHNEVRTEEEIYKWLQSEKAGYDLGEGCIQQWVKEHWTGYLRARWVEHLQGKCFWIELHQCDFGILQRKFVDRKVLLNNILDQLKSGKENLQVVIWAVSEGIEIDPVREILEALNVNSSRLLHRFESP